MSNFPDTTTINRFFDNEEPKQIYQEKIEIYQENNDNDYSELSDDSLIESDEDLEENRHTYTEILDDIVTSILNKTPFTNKNPKSKCTNCKTQNSKEWYVGPKGYNSLCEECANLYYKGKIALDESGKSQINVDDFIVDKKRKRQNSLENKKKKHEFTEKEKDDLLKYYKKEIEEYEKIQPDRINNGFEKFNIDRAKLRSFIQYHRKDCDCPDTIHQKKNMFSK